MTNHPNGGGISRRIHGEERDKIKNHIEALNVPENMSVIIRTAGIDKQIEELKWDLEYLKKLWVEVESAIKGSRATQLIYADQSLIQKTIRDYFKEDIGELVVDNEDDFNSAKTYTNKIVPEEIKPQFGEGLRKVMDNIFCLFGNLIGGLNSMIKNFLKSLISTFMVMNSVVTLIHLMHHLLLETPNQFSSVTQ